MVCTLFPKLACEASQAAYPRWSGSRNPLITTSCRLLRPQRGRKSLSVRADAGVTELGRFLLRVDQVFEEIGLGPLWRRFDNKTHSGLYTAAVLFSADGVCRVMDNMPPVSDMFRMVGLLYAVWFGAYVLTDERRRSAASGTLAGALEQLYLPGMTDGINSEKETIAHLQEELGVDSCGLGLGMESCEERR